MSGSRRLRTKGPERRKRFAPAEKAQHTCSCGKQAYGSKAEAKKVARTVHVGEPMNTYKCGDRFHIGHLPLAVRAGVITRLERYG